MPRQELGVLFANAANAECEDETLQRYTAPGFNRFQQFADLAFAPTFKACEGFPLLVQTENISRAFDQPGIK